MKRRRNYTNHEATQELSDWMWRKKMRQVDFIKWLAERGITMSAAYLSMMLTGKIPPGKQFKAVFKEITGITLVDGLIEREKVRKP